MASRIIKYGFGIGLVGSSIGFLSLNQWKIENLGVVRLGRAAFTVSRIAFDYKLTFSRLNENDPNYDIFLSDLHRRAAQRLLLLCNHNRGVYIKVGQHIATLEFLVPKEYCQVLSVLHNDAPKSSIEEIYSVVAKDLKKPVEELFDEFEREPIGTASLAQVHKAKLKKTGEIVAVKVQHPNVRGHSLIDITTMDVLVKLVNKLFPEFSFLWLANEMKINLPLELDFIHEGHNAEKMKKIFSTRFSWFRVPNIYWNYSTQRVLTMEFIDGGKVTDKDYMMKNNINVREVSRLLGLVYSKMILNEGYVHCDPHPGNILVRKDSNQNTQIVLLDHGLYLNLTEKFRHQYCQLWLSIINFNAENVKKWGKELGADDLYQLLACILAAKSWYSLEKGITKTRSVEKIKEEDEEIKKYAREYLPEIAKILSRVPREMLLIFKTNDLLRGIETSLGTKGERRSLITMSKCCVETVYQQQLNECKNVFTSMKIRLVMNYTLFKLSLFQFYLWLNTFIGRKEYL